MNKLINIFFLITALILLSCESPTEIDSTRKKEVTVNPNEDMPILSFSQKSLYFGYVERNLEKILTVKVTNELNHSLEINELKFAKYSSLFYIPYHTEFPIFIDKKGSNNDTKEIKIACRYISGINELGYLKDTLIINNLVSPKLPVSVLIPQVFITNNDYENTPINISKFGSIKIINQGNVSITVSDINLNQEDSTFHFQDEIKLPFTIQPSTEIYIPILFLPKKTGKHSTEVEFVIRPILQQSILKAVLTGYGI